MDPLETVFARLREILLPYAKELEIKTDSDDELFVDTRHIRKNKKPLFFGAVQIKKRYVSFHLMPVYVQPGLLDPVSPELKRRMQGKSCFNFTKVDEALFKQLEALTKQAYASYKKQGFI